jgi:hypothetical protein
MTGCDIIHLPQAFRGILSCDEGGMDVRKEPYRKG